MSFMLIRSKQTGRIINGGIAIMEAMPPRSFERPYERVAEDLRARLNSGEWESGEALPSVAALAGEYNVSRSTISHALVVLADEGLVRTVPRWGTFRA
jgi:DNA-binding GntR family transcriptional regulator